MPAVRTCEIVRAMRTHVATPDGYHTLTPRMVVSDVAGAVQFLRSIFDATGDIPDGRAAEITVGDSLVMVSPVGERKPFPALLYIYVADADESFRRTVAAGAETIEAPVDTPQWRQTRDGSRSVRKRLPDRTSSHPRWLNLHASGRPAFR